MHRATTRRTSSLRKFRVGLVCLTLAASAAPAAARDRVGPEFGNNRFETTIRPQGGVADHDVYEGRLLAGETLVVKVTAAKKSDLLPQVRVFDPDGNDRTPELKLGKGGAKVAFRKPLSIDRTGHWTVRIDGQDAAAEGGYRIAFKVGAARPVKLKKQTMTAGERTIPVDGLTGALLTLKLKASKKQQPVTVQSFTDPQDDDVPGSAGLAVDDLVRKGTKASWKKLPLADGDGAYGLTLGVAEGTGLFDLIWKVQVVDRVKNKKYVTLAEAEDPLLQPRTEPLDGATGVVARIHGFNLLDSQTVLIDGKEAQVMGADPAQEWIEVMPPPGLDHAVVSVRVTSVDGQSDAYEGYFRYVPAMTVSGSAVVFGPEIGTDEVPLLAGNTLRISGTNLDLVSTVRIDGTPVALDSQSFGTLELTVPAGPAGLSSAQVEDHLGRTIDLPDVFRRVGFVNSTTTRSPAPDDDDDFSAWRGAIGDLDGDTRPDDLVIGSYNVLSQYAEDPNVPGDRRTLTRPLRFTTGFRLVDAGDSAPATTQSNDWNVLALAVGDLDGLGADDVVIAGSVAADTNGDPQPTTGLHLRFRLWLSDGVGGFGADFEDQPPLFELPLIEADTELTFEDPETGRDVIMKQTIWSEEQLGQIGAAVALGDLDKDGDLDIVAGATRSSQRTLYVDPSYVNYDVTPYYIASSDVVDVGITYYYSATRIFRNDLSDDGGFVDVTGTKMPSAGTDQQAPTSGFHARDIALGDLDGDGWLDMTVTWNNPASVSPIGARTSFEEYVFFYGTRFHRYIFDSDTTLLTATRVLLNDQSGGFTDASDTWMPANDPSTNEYWQAHRVKVGDLDGDGDLDMVLQHRRRLDAFRGDVEAEPRLSLRVLRNDRINVGGVAAERFVDVTDTALPAPLAGSDDNYRGTALCLADVNQDGNMDLVFGTREVRKDASDAPIRSYHVLFGRGDMTFVDGRPFLPSYASDSGEVTDLLFDALDTDVGMLFLLSEVTPANSEDGRHLRVFDWLR